MRQFKITVNGKAYQVEVEELGKVENTGKSTVAQGAKGTSQTTASTPPKAKVADKAEFVTVPEGGTNITAPMPGTILDIKIRNGDTVKTGDVLIILEAMKMENEIVSPFSGAVASVQVKKGDSVNSGDVLVALNQ